MNSVAAQHDITTNAASLHGKRIMVVEDDYLLATDLCRGLADLGATVLGPAPTPFYALGLLGRRGVDAAVLDVRLHGTDVFEVAAELRSRQIPIIFATASSVEDLPARYRGCPLLQKPYEKAALHATLHEALFSPAPESRKASSHDDMPDIDRLMRAVVTVLRRS